MAVSTCLLTEHGTSETPHLSARGGSPCMDTGANARAAATRLCVAIPRCTQGRPCRLQLDAAADRCLLLLAGLFQSVSHRLMVSHVVEHGLAGHRHARRPTLRPAGIDSAPRMWPRLPHAPVLCAWAACSPTSMKSVLSAHPRPHRFQPWAACQAGTTAALSAGRQC